MPIRTELEQEKPNLRQYRPQKEALESAAAENRSGTLQTGEKKKEKEIAAGKPLERVSSTRTGTGFRQERHTDDVIETALPDIENESQRTARQDDR
jgi:hypothetical protein